MPIFKVKKTFGAEVNLSFASENFKVKSLPVLFWKPQGKVGCLLKVPVKKPNFCLALAAVVAPVPPFVTAKVPLIPLPKLTCTAPFLTIGTDWNCSEFAVVLVPLPNCTAPSALALA